MEEGKKEGREKGLEEGREKGLEEGKKEGIEEEISLLIRKFLQKNPDMTDEAVAEYFEISVDLVRSARQ